MGELSFTQKEILRALVKLYSKGQKLVKSTDIAKELGKDDGTIRNVILSLKSLGLIESKTGPSGGYRPTSKAYSYLRSLSDTSIVYAKVRKNGEELNVYVLNVELMDVPNPYSSKAVLKVVGDLDQVRVGDRIKVGPLLTYRLVLSGLVLLIDTYRSEIIVEVESLVSIPKITAKDVIGVRKLITIDASHTINDAAKMLSVENIRGLPVVNNDGKLLGMITSADVIKAFISGEAEAPISKYMRTNVIIASPEEEISEIISKMNRYNTGRILVVIEGKPLGIITRTDILRILACLS